MCVSVFLQHTSANAPCVLGQCVSWIPAVSPRNYSLIHLCVCFTVLMSGYSLQKLVSVMNWNWKLHTEAISATTLKNNKKKNQNNFETQHFPTPLAPPPHIILCLNVLYLVSSWCIHLFLFHFSNYPKSTPS